MRHRISKPIAVTVLVGLVLLGVVWLWGYSKGPELSNEVPVRCSVNCR